MKIWFTSDLHFGHSNVIKYCNRPFQSVEEMDRGLIENWNEVVQEGDEVYVLGDLCFRGPAYLAPLLERLKGRKYLVKGNHDKRIKESFYLKYFEWVKDYYELKVPSPELESKVQRIVLFHFPIESWNMAHYGAWHLHGHCHGTLADSSRKRVDVGVDCWNYRPVSYEQLKEVMAKKVVEQVDHHTQVD